MGYRIEKSKTEAQKTETFAEFKAKRLILDTEIQRIEEDIKNLKSWLKNPLNHYFRSSIKLQIKQQKLLLKQLKQKL